MKIAQLAPLVERVPPKKYGGTERVVHALTEELVRRGHEVTLFATGDSLTSARLESVYPRSLREGHVKDIYGLNQWTLLSLGLAYEMQDEFDIIHDHLVPMSLPTANLSTTPVVATMHGPFAAEDRRLFETLSSPAIVTISKSQAYFSPRINHAGTVYNGLPMEHYPFGGEPGEYLLFVGRLMPEKGAHLAIEVAQQLDMPLILAAKLERMSQNYFRDYIEPGLSERIRWIGEVDEEERNRLMSEALCLLHPITWREPFGLTLIEAMACGCPVVALNRGSIPELVKSGETGFVVEDVESMVDAVGMLGTINRSACRAYVLEQFSVTNMADGYEKIYDKLMGNKEKGAIA